eukprot:gnl/TRDRNA2_/TRDRNA2_177861_c0_seq2.p2 gnl/TRDRNA2_/TRDRNA2_177861_c0~~gnl/TRDRNA2_/TRDRNA2_177861_c0_seq2.p2  ORF type:complete len:115 (+),score=26.22 gnl/TRDRNA2_/TRDRNA2_177861_c0_seq2:213-557(+)
MPIVAGTQATAAGMGLAGAALVGASANGASMAGAGEKLAGAGEKTTGDAETKAGAGSKIVRAGAKVAREGSQRSCTERAWNDYILFSFGRNHCSQHFQGGHSSSATVLLHQDMS